MRISAIHPRRDALSALHRPARLTSAEEFPALPYRGAFGAVRPAGLPTLPPAPLPAHRGVTPLKAWRYVGCFGPELMVTAAQIRVGPVRRSFYAIWDRRGGALHDGDGAAGQVQFALGCVRVRHGPVQLELRFPENAGIETVSALGDSYAWTRKQGGQPAHGRVMLSGQPREFSGRVIIDDSAGYHPRHTHWRWSAGVGSAMDGRPLAWNLVEGLHDAETNSERTLWVDGEPREVPRMAITPDLGSAGSLTFRAEHTRTRTENRILVRSRYRQPFGSFSGAIDGVALAAGCGVMEEHDAHW